MQSEQEVSSVISVFYNAAALPQRLADSVDIAKKMSPEQLRTTLSLSRAGMSKMRLFTNAMQEEFERR